VLCIWVFLSLWVLLWFSGEDGNGNGNGEGVGGCFRKRNEGVCMYTVSRVSLRHLGMGWMDGMGFGGFFSGWVDG